MKILGIDPGTSRIGFGLIEATGPNLELLTYGIIEAKDKTITGKITELSTQFRKLLLETTPDFAAVEKLFFAKNQKTALDVAQARGVILSLLLEKGIPLAEYAPNEVKIQVTGYGLADKQGVAKMVKTILKVSELPGHDDASDALAVAITAANFLKLQQRQNKF